MFPIPPFLRFFRLVSWSTYITGVAVGMCLLGVVYSLAWGQQQYTIVDLGPGGAFAIADNSSLIVGIRERQAAILSDPPQLLGWLPNTLNPYGYALGASAYGIVGTSSLIQNISFQPHAFLWTATDGMRDLATDDPAPGPVSTYATDINDTGMIVGYRTGPGSSGGPRGAVRFAATGGSSALPGAAFVSQALSLNAYGDATGINDTHAVLWPITGGIVDLHPLGATRSIGASINDTMLVCGEADGVSGTADTRGVLWFDVESYRVLSPLPDDLHSTCTDINTAGIMVGRSYTYTDLGIAFPAADPRAVRWTADSDQAEDLNTLLGDNPDGWILEDAVGINNAGVIIGSGTLHGEQHAWALVPLTPPAPAPEPAPSPAPAPQPTPHPPLAKKTHDLDGDGTDDLLFHNTHTGHIAAWFLSHGRLKHGAWLGQVPDTAWRLIGMGDLNGDGHPDMVWRHRETGDVGLWFMHKTQIIAAMTSPASLAYHLEAIGDMNGDGTADLLWRHATTGGVYTWLMQKGKLLYATTIADAFDMSWNLVTVGDINGDGHTDIVWRHSTTGDVAYWPCVNGTPTGGYWLAHGIDLGWQLNAVADTDGDGHADLVWKHGTSGQVWTWRLNDGSFQGVEQIGETTEGWQMH